MNIFKYELKTYMSSIITWILSLSAIIILFMVFFPTFAKDAAFMDTLMENYPEELLKAFGMAGGLSLSSVAGFFAVIFAFAQLCIAIQASNYGFSILSIEERELTADFLMSKPISRNTILITKFIAALVALIITNLGIWLSTYISLELFSDGKSYEVKGFIVLLVSIMLFQLVFMSVGMVISVLVKKIRSVLSYSMALAFGLYMLNAVGLIIDSELLLTVSPFYHFEPAYILERGYLNWSVVMISVVVTIVSLVATYVLYNRRNIHSL